MPKIDYFFATLSPYVYIAGAESGRVPTSQISDILGVDGAHEVAELARDLLGSERADLNPPEPDAGPPPTTAPAVSLPSGLQPLDEDGS